VAIARLRFGTGNASLSSDAPLKVSIHCREAAARSLSPITVRTLAAIVFVHCHGCHLPN